MRLIYRLVRRKKRYSYVLFGLLFLVVSVVSFLLFDNSLQANWFVRNRTSEYLSNVSFQIAENINSRIHHSVQTLRMLRDSAILFEPEQARSFLERKKGYAEYDELILFDSAEETAQWLMEVHPGATIDMNELKRGSEQLLAIPEQDMLIYCVPEEHMKDPAVLVGIKRKSILQELLSYDSFQGRGTSFVVLRDLTVVAQPEENDLMGALINNGMLCIEDDSEAAQKIQQDIAVNQSGLIQIVENGRQLMVRYEPLQYRDWTIVTVLPSNIISMGIDVLSTHNLILASAVILLLFASLVILVVSSRQSKKKLERLAFYDSLTGGMNDTSFRLAAQQLLREEVHSYALVSVDLLEFKLINKVFGTAEGNRTLVYVYQQLKGHLREDEPVARDFGDVFYFLLKNRNESEIIARLERIYLDANQYSGTEQSAFSLDLYFGIYLPDNADEPLAEMQEKANLARKHKKGDFRYRYQFYDERSQEQHLKEKELMNEVDRALQRGEFQVYLQPKVELRNGRVAGAEALLRWKHPEMGMLSPAMFIPLAERYRLICRLDLYVFEWVCKTLARWKEEGKQQLPISVNLSRQNMDTPNFLDDYRRLYRKYKINPALIEFELTETILFQDPEGIKGYIDEMHSYGFKCSLDDFGTGFSSLGLLNDLDVDVIKLDRSFFVGKNDNRRGRRIIEAILRLAAQLHIRTVAEGIDDLKQVQYLCQATCDMIQGFYFFKPMPIEQFEEEVYQDGEPIHVEPFLPQTEEQDAQTALSEEQSADNMVLFSYFVEEDRVIFSSAFSPVLEGRNSFQEASALFRTSPLIHENDREDFFRGLERCRWDNVWHENTLRFCTSEGRYDWLELYLHQDKRYDGGGTVITGLLVNTSVWKSELNHWKEKANRDALTGLYNREYFEHYMKMQLESGSLTSAAIIFIDIDDFKQANDTLGHSFGDDILCCMAKRILGVFRHTDIAARYGGDEFVAFIPDVSREVLVARLNQLCGVFRFPYRNGKVQYKMSGSIGAAIYPDHGQDYETLLGNADSALYEAKNRGKDQWVLYQHDEPGKRAAEAETGEKR